MKIIKISGSAAEQMFQYALYLRLRADGQQVAIDAPKHWITAQFQLSGYTQATAEQLAGYRTSLTSRLKGIVGKPAAAPNIITDGAFGLYSREVIDAEDGLCKGVWASPQYFEAVADEVRKAFIVPDHLLSAAASAIPTPPASRETVALHIHRPTNPANTCTTDYYNWAIANIRTYIPDAQFVVFTAEADLVRQCLLLPDDAIMVSTAELSEHDLLQAMLRASHIICANTLTSWWAAWLNPNPDKIVIVPQKWIAGTDCQPQHLMPIYWTAIPVT